MTSLVTIDNVAKQFGERLLEEVACLLEEVACLLSHVGDRIGLIGINGCGKSTLLRLVAGKTGFEDSPLNHLNLPAVEIGLRHSESVSIDVI